MPRPPVQLRHIILLLRDLRQGIQFYGKDGLGLEVTVASDRLAEVSTGSESPSLLLKVADREADCSTGYSPILNFDVDNMDETVKRLMVQGGVLDGPIKYPSHGKVAAIRSPDGHMISLYEKND